MRVRHGGHDAWRRGAEPGEFGRFCTVVVGKGSTDGRPSDTRRASAGYRPFNSH